MEQQNDFNPKKQLFRVGERMLRSSQRTKQPVSLLVLEVVQLEKLKSTLGPDASKVAVGAIMRQLEHLASKRGWAARTSKTVFTVLMPCTDRAAALTAIRATLGRPWRIETEANGKELALVPEFRVTTLGGESLSVEETYEAMRRDIAHEREVAEARLQGEAQAKDLRRRQSLQNERRRQSLLIEQEAIRRRMASMASMESPQACHTTIPATLPMPLGLQ